MGFLHLGSTYQLVTSEMSHRQQQKPKGVVICIICDSLTARNTPSRNCKLKTRSDYISVFIFYLTTNCGCSFFFSGCEFCSCLSIDFGGMILQLFKQMQRSVCKVKSYSIIGSEDNLTVRNTYQLPYLGQALIELSDLHAEL